MTSLFSSGYSADPVHNAIKRREHSNYCADVDAAPFERALWCTARDQLGTYRLPFPVKRTETNGWVNANTRARLSVSITGWKWA